MQYEGPDEDGTLTFRDSGRVRYITAFITSKDAVTKFLRAVDRARTVDEIPRPDCCRMFMDSGWKRAT